MEVSSEGNEPAEVHLDLTSSPNADANASTAVTPEDLTLRNSIYQETGIDFCCWLTKVFIEEVGVFSLYDLFISLSDSGEISSEVVVSEIPSIGCRMARLTD
ncbi:hypothetical protein CDAR_514811 [Caerostris darwini]|uniref:Uncharacterized protein n=1 Tax=Caerostris darwini TaxID=1538125 RepID=A0AAV4SKM8_9ARAC|nr:hypothetical protein CDAR_514811 [Caerostris darwini]